MTESYETLKLGGNERNAERLGLLVAWLVSNDHLNISLQHSAGAAIARVRMQDMDGPAFLTTVLNGELKPEHLSDSGRAFLDLYFISGQFNIDYDACNYKGENEWVRYDELSPLITAAFQRFNQPQSRVKGSAKSTAKIIQFPFRR